MLVKIMWCFLKIVFNDVEPKMTDTKLKAIAELAGGEITEQSMQFAKTLMDTSNN